MPSSPSRRLSTVNIPRMALWLASIVVAVCGWFLMTTSNSNEAAIYTAGKADYPKLFAAQSGSTIGGLLIAVGVLGALLALTSLAVTRRSTSTPEGAVVDAAVLDAGDIGGDRVDQSAVTQNANDSDPAAVR